MSQKPTTVYVRVSAVCSAYRSSASVSRRSYSSAPTGSVIVSPSEGVSRKYARAFTDITISSALSGSRPALRR